MSDQTDTASKLLTSLELSAEESAVFLYLNQNPESTALSISRSIHMSRTKVYRILDTLIAKKLVAQVLGDRGLRFEVPANLNLDLLLAQKEEELKILKESIPLIQKQLIDSSVGGRHKSKVTYFHGKQGLEQVTWNSTKAKDVLRIYEVGESMAEFTDYGFSEKVRNEFLKNKVFTKQLTNFKKIAGFTQVAEIVNKYWECRFVDPKKLALKFETLVYNDVVALYTYKKEEIFCVEIHNPYLAQMQTQIFDFVWATAKPLKILNSSGLAKLV